MTRFILRARPLVRPVHAKPATHLGVLILAAGEGTRMESVLPKVLHPLGGHPMIVHVLRLANALKPAGIGVVIGHQADQVKPRVEETLKVMGIHRPVQFIRQSELTGSGRAVLESMSFLKKFQTAVVVCGDAPLLTFETVFAMLRIHQEQKAAVTLLSARLSNPRGYGRVVRSPLGEVLKVVEETDATPKEAQIQEVNSGAYCFEVPRLVQVLKEIKSQGPKQELYLTEALELIRSKGFKIQGYVTPAAEEVLGVNNRVQLAQVERVFQRRVLERLMLSGVSILDALHTYVDADVEVGPDTVLHPGTVLRGKTRIGRDCVIGPYTYVEDSSLGNGVEAKFSVILQSRVLEKSVIGPFSHLRGQSTVGPRARIGNFSEVKASRIGFGSKVPHLSYVGDAEIAEDVNVGAGAITCNYDGVSKHKTIIGPKAFIGSNVNLIAPIKVGRGARVGAGSTITEDVPDDSLAIARARQVVKFGVNGEPKGKGGKGSKRS